MSSREIGLVLLSALLHAVWNLSTKGSRNPLAFGVLLDVATAAGLLLLTPWFPYREIPVDVWVLLVVSAAVHAVYFYWLTRSYQHADLSVVYPISRSTPAFVPFLAVPFLGERLSIVGAIGIGIVVAGIWLVHADGLRWRNFRDRGVRLALLTLGATVFYSLLDKEGVTRLAASEWTSFFPRAIAYYLVVETFTLCFFYTLARRRLPRGTLREVARAEWGTVLRAAVIAFASYSLILEALRTAPVSYVVAARQTSVIFAVAMSMVWLRERPGPFRLLGALATVVGVVLVSRG